MSLGIYSLKPKLNLNNTQQIQKINNLFMNLKKFLRTGFLTVKKMIKIGKGAFIFLSIEHSRNLGF